MNLIASMQPLFILLGGTLSLLLVISWWKKINKEVFLSLAIILLGVFIYISWKGWLNPTGIFQVLVFDKFSFIGFIFFALSAAMALIGAHNYFRCRAIDSSEYIVLVLFAVFGGCIMASGINLIVIFIGLETLSLAAYVLAGFDKKDAHSQEASIKYFVMGAVASAIFLFGIAFYYGAYGTLNIEHLNVKHLNSEIFSLIATGLIIAGLGFKIAAVPFQWWTPDVYQGSPLPVTTFFATTVKAAAFFALFRVLSADTIWITPKLNVLLAAISIATMSFGNLAALFQEDVKRMLAYSSIAHAGYMLLAFTFISKDPGLASSSLTFYLLSYFFMTTGAFTVLTYLSSTSSLPFKPVRQPFGGGGPGRVDNPPLSRGGSGGVELTHISNFTGLGRSSPWLAFALSVFLISLIGVPPTAGFFAKFYLFKSTLWHGHTSLVIVAVINSLISAYYYMRPVIAMYFTQAETETLKQSSTETQFSLIGVITFCLICVILLGLFPSTILSILTN